MLFRLTWQTNKSALIAFRLHCDECESTLTMMNVQQNEQSGSTVVESGEARRGDAMRCDAMPRKQEARAKCRWRRRRNDGRMRSSFVIATAQRSRGAFLELVHPCAFSDFPRSRHPIPLRSEHRPTRDFWCSLRFAAKKAVHTSSRILIPKKKKIKKNKNPMQLGSSFSITF